MQHRCLVAAAAALIAGAGLASPANAACSSSKGCASSSQSVHAPLKLDRYMKGHRNSRRHSVARTRSHSHHRARKAKKENEQQEAKKREATPAESKTVPAPAPQNTVALTPKPVPTTTIEAPSPGQQAIGFAAAHEPWSRANVFAKPGMTAGSLVTTDDASPPPRASAETADAPQVSKAEMQIVPPDQVNSIDLAADKQTGPTSDAAKSSRSADLSLVTAANAAERAKPAAEKPVAEESWWGWFRGICAKGLSAAILAITTLLT